MRPKNPYASKPGTQHTGFKPDVIEIYTPQADCRLLDFLFQSMPQRKRTNVKELLKHNQVAVNGIPVTRFDTLLTPADEVKVNLTREFRLFSNRRVKLIYEDDDIIVIEKGYGLLSMGTDKVKDGTLPGQQHGPDCYWLPPQRYQRCIWDLSWHSG